MRNVLNITLAFLLSNAAMTAAPRELHVAAAANLSNVLPALSAAFGKKTGVHIVPSMGATAQLTQQIENGAPFDVFLSADVEHVDQLAQKQFIIPETRALYARGELVVWAPHVRGIRSLNDLTKPDVHSIAVAKPELAPYGEAAVEVLKAAKLWDKVEKKIVYAPSIAAAKQYADTGNAEAAFTALALTINDRGNSFVVDDKLHKPINQALGIVKVSGMQKEARAFVAFLMSSEGRAIFRRFGYGQP
ncbi:MAG TPA: molybdate ABC transporter substrate-binding protein [Bryobacteraceae bacterium]|jgi:molybdate transport system substrate-binding protein|nr:molybdate ABC transporter substrate-binding protein [Bryobacteraceae bacterium]